MAYSYGAVRRPDGQPAIYVANDDDWEAEMEAEAFAEVEEEHWVEEELEEAEEPAPIRLQLSELPMEVYWDESALTNCWEAALTDYKVRSHLGAAIPRV